MSNSENKSDTLFFAIALLIALAICALLIKGAFPVIGNAYSESSLSPSIQEMADQQKADIEECDRFAAMKKQGISVPFTCG